MTERPDAIAGLTADPRPHLVAPLGILAMPLDPRTAGLLPGLRSSAGVVVVSSAPGAIDSRAGRLLPGDVIRGVNRSPVATLEALRAALQGAGTGTAVVLHLERGGELMYLAFLAE
jgi:serine protease Do